jgi:sugar lactone lactonase YvrE
MKTLFRSAISCSLLVAVSALSGLGQSSTITATISTYAGPTAPLAGSQAVTQFIASYAAIPDGAGGFYVSGDNIVYRVDRNGTLSVIAGTGAPGFSGDGPGPATSAALNFPAGLALDGSGNLFIADTYNNRIRKVTPDGMISTVAGVGEEGFSGDGGPAISAHLAYPYGLAVDGAGNLYIADTGNNRIRKVTCCVDGAPVINTVAGNGTYGSGGEYGPATSAQLGSPHSVAVDSAGNLFIADLPLHLVRKVTPDGIIHRVAGNGMVGFSGDGGPATSATLFWPDGLAVDGAGNLYIADPGNYRVRKVTPGGVINTVAGTNQLPFGGDGGPATSAGLNYVYSVALEESGALVISEDGRVRRVTPDGLIHTVAGNGPLEGFSGDHGPATSARLNYPTGIAADPCGNVFIGDTYNNVIRKVTPEGTISTVAGNGTYGYSGDGASNDGGPATSAALANPSGVTGNGCGDSDTLYIADTGNNRIRGVWAGVIRTVVGWGGQPGFSGDGGRASDARVQFPQGVTVDSHGDLYIADTGNNRIRKVTCCVNGAPVINTVAGNGTDGSGGDGGPATSAQLSNPYSVAVDSAGNLFIADFSNHRVRKVTPDGIIHTVAGTGTEGFSGDGGSATSAALTAAWGVAVDAPGNLYFSDYAEAFFGGDSCFYFLDFGCRIRKVTPDGVINTIAGDGIEGFYGDGGPAAFAQLAFPAGLAVDAAGNLFVADSGNSRIRKITFTQQVPFSMSDRGGVSLHTAGTSSQNTVGYAAVQPDAGSLTPAGLAILGLRQNDVLVSEAGVPASPLIQTGRIYVEVNDLVNTGLAIANPSNQLVKISFFFTGASGETETRNLSIPPNGQVSAFLDSDLFFESSDGGLPWPFIGTFSFSSSAPIAVIALRVFINERNEFLITTLPVTDLSALASGDPTVFPHFADGGGWTSQIVLVNPGDTTLTGTLQFVTHDGVAQVVTVNGQTNSSFAYSIKPRTSQKFQTAGWSASAVSGSVRAVPNGGSASPSGLTIFSLRKDGTTTTESGVPAQAAGNAFRLYAESKEVFGDVGSIQTGLAVVNMSNGPATVVLELSRLDGTSTGLTGTLYLAANGQTAIFLNQIPGLTSLQTPFEGVLRVSSSSPIAVLGLLCRYNERGDFLITTTPASNEAAPPSTSPLYFPQIADGNGYTTQFILFSGQAGESSTGTLVLFNQLGGALNAVIQ